VAETGAGARKCDLVCEGGGVKGIGLAGAFAGLSEAGYVPGNVAGTSAGAITAALIAAGYTADELKEVVLSLDFRQFEDKGWEDRIPLLHNALSILLDQGIYEGERFHAWMAEMLATKGVHTFADLRTDDDDPRYAYRLQVIVSDVSARELLVLPRDAGKLGLDPDKLEVALAVRMSMSIPIFFEPVRIENQKTNWEHVLVDGGMLSNFPVWLFDSDGVPDWPTFGLLLVEPSPRTPITERIPKPERSPKGVRGLVQLLSGMLHTMMEAHDRMYVQKEQFARTIGIPTLGVGTTEFGITRDRALELYESGRSAAAEFLEDWDFDAYVAEFRSGKEHSRRADIVAELQQASPAAPAAPVG
jgi:NTE family protein